jgi:copper oxidase (laccase) domain-containing protein
MSTTKTKIGYPYSFPSLPKVDVRVFGSSANFRVEDWDDPDRFRPVAIKAASLGIREIFVPKPSDFNGLVVDKESFPYTTKICGVRIRYGAIADGVILRRGMSTAIITGDCPTVTMVAGKIVIAAHAGLASLLPQPFRLGDSVIDRMMNLVASEQRAAAEVLVSCHIQPASFIYPPDDPKYGEVNRERQRFITDNYGHWAPWILPGLTMRNREWCNDGKIDLFYLIVAQIKRIEGQCTEIYDDGIDTAASGSDFHSQCRDRATSGRNAVIVWHRR